MEPALNRKQIISTLLWGNVHVENVQLTSAWKAGCDLVENNEDLAEFNPTEKLRALEAQTGADLLNPYGSAPCEDCKDEGEEHTQFQENVTTGSVRGRAHSSVVRVGEHWDQPYA